MFPPPPLTPFKIIYKIGVSKASAVAAISTENPATRALFVRKVASKAIRKKSRIIICFRLRKF
jgi:hypothetical protein